MTLISDSKKSKSAIDSLSYSNFTNSGYYTLCGHICAHKQLILY